MSQQGNMMGRPPVTGLSGAGRPGSEPPVHDA